MADWRKLALVLIIIGYELDIFAITSYAFAGDKNAVEALQICGFLCYTLALLLALLTVFGELSTSRAATIAFIIFSFLAGLFMIIGLAVYGARVNKHVPVYPTTLLVVGAAFGISAGVFAVMSIVRGW